MIGVPHLRRDRRKIVAASGLRIVAAIHHDATESQVDEVGALEVLPRSGVTEWCDAAVHEGRKAPSEIAAVQSQLRLQLARRGVEQEVRTRIQAEEFLAATSVGKVQCD